MQTLTHNGRQIRYYTDIDEFPAGRRSVLTQHQLEAAEFPTNPIELGEKLGAIMTAYNDDRKQEGHIMMQNLYLGIQAIADNYNPTELSFGALIHDVDGVPVTDLSADGLRKLLRELEIPLSTIQRITEDVKKNSAPAASYISLGLETVA